MEKELEKDMTPKLIGETYLKKPTETSRQRYKYGIYRCQYCGEEFECVTHNIKNGHTRSCGCLIGKQTGSHNLYYHRFYHTWNGVMQRCNNPKHKRYKDYGGRGISVCEEWLDIRNFVDWVENKSNWEEGLTLDRIDNDKGYSPDNCTFSTKTIQAINRRQKSNNTSGYVGVSWYAKVSKWRARVNMFKKEKLIGYYLTLEEAVQARDSYIIENNLPHPLSTDYDKENK